MFLSLLLPFLLALALPAGAAPHEEDDVAFQPFDVRDTFPDTAFTVVTGAIPGTIVAVYTDAQGHQSTLVTAGRQRSALPLLTAQDVSLAGVTGWFLAPGTARDGGAITASFLLQDGTLTWLQVPRVGGIGTPVNTLTEALAINDAGQVCGDFRRAVDGTFYGFRFTPPATYLTIAVPGALSTACLWIAPDGRLLVRGVFAGGVARHYLWEGGTMTELTVPDLPGADLVAFRGGLLAGNAGAVGFTWDRETGALTVIEVPGSTLTELHGLQADGHGPVRVYGRYRKDGAQHGFLATLGPPAWRRPTAHHVAKMYARVAPAECWQGSKRPVCVAARRAQEETPQ